MGIKSNIGIYLVVELKPIMVEKNVLFCEEHKELASSSVEFCPGCGRKLSSRSYSEEEFPAFDDIVPEDSPLPLVCVDVYDEEDRMLMICYDFDEEKPVRVNNEKEEIEITPDVISGYMQNFRDKYSEVTDVIRGRVESLEVKFGIVQYWD